MSSNSVYLDGVQLQFVEHSNRRKMRSYSMCRKISIAAIIFIWLYFVANNIFVWLGRFALRQVATLRHGHMARRFAPAFRALGVCEHI